jgi:hypothetical protein
MSPRRSLTDALRRALRQPAGLTTYYDAVAWQLVNSAAKGDTAAAALVLQYVEGLPQPQERPSVETPRLVLLRPKETA